MKNTVFVLLFALTAQMAFGWGKNGHLIVGKLADQYLTAKARAEVKKILGDEDLGTAGLWLDIPENMDLYKHQDNWHYAYKDATLEENALATMDRFINELKSDTTSQEEKLLALRSVIHIVGDLHVPLHCGYKKDAGGHKPKLKWEGSEEKTNLHKVWDTDMLFMREENVDTYVANLQGYITAEKKELWMSADVSVWVNESQELLDQAYDFEGKVIPKSYYEQNIVVVDDRLGMSAIRLANLLNTIFE